MEKPCTICKEIKPLECFRKSKSKALKPRKEFYHSPECINCDLEKKRIYRLNNLEKEREKDRQRFKSGRKKPGNPETIRAYYEKNKDVIAKRHREYRILNPEKYKKIWLEYYNSHVKENNARSAKYRAYRGKATPKWVTKEELEAIKEFYRNCPEGYEVDHIIPLKGKTVCGLHILANLQYLPMRENRSKGNRILNEIVD